MARYGMVIDLKKCVGCNACVVACKSEHSSPNGIFQTMVLEQEKGVFPNAIRLFVPVLCNHCENPACVEVCPTGATYRREDGLVLIDNQKCIGCCACIEHCPYNARSLVKDNRILFPDNETMFEKPVAQPVLNNTVIKCDFCYHRIGEHLQPLCCEVCPTQARIFGDLKNDQSKIHSLTHCGGVWQMLTEHGTNPSIFYIGNI